MLYQWRLFHICIVLFVCHSVSTVAISQLPCTVCMSQCNLVSYDVLQQRRTSSGGRSSSSGRTATPPPVRGRSVCVHPTAADRHTDPALRSKLPPQHTPQVVLGAGKPHPHTAAHACALPRRPYGHAPHAPSCSGMARQLESTLANAQRKFT